MAESNWPLLLAVSLPIAAMLVAALHERHRRNTRDARLLAAMAVGAAALAGGVAGWVA
jgi:hypothetical protein